ncbi:MAG TPA: F0F1 ATP synthase subunit gamma [Alphaproteobacteria bacterium]|jgi:F-type H+-transporting ATPase subunit gamma|nr:F0F1 ATP synthase subunit gamma [Alphaproteobacteria bacterium]
MPSLKDLRNSIGSVRNMKKITSAMKMVAASKLRRAQEQAQIAQPYAERMAGILSRLAANYVATESSPKLLTGTGKDHVHLLVVVTSDRGLAGGFNSNSVREARRVIRQLLADGKEVKVLTVGRKAKDLLRRDQASRMTQTFEGIGSKRVTFAEAESVANAIVALYDAGEFDVCTIIYNRFKSVISQVPTAAQLIPFALPTNTAKTDSHAVRPVYEFEPSEDEILEALLPRNFAIQIYGALLDSAAGEQAARMTAMDNASRNAEDLTKKLTLRYNRARQAAITKELIEIVSGAEAL